MKLLHILSLSIILLPFLTQINTVHGQALDTATCERQHSCNGQLCAEICVPGTVEIDDWAVNSLNFQRQLQQNLSLTYYQLPGTHNAYQSQSSGVGVEEEGLHELFVEAKYTENNVVLQNQRYSVTDQLRMGLRWIELDIWGFVKQYDDIRLCHDPFPDPRLLYWVEKAEKQTGRHLDWDPVNLGCFSKHNKNLETGLKELNDWLSLPENEKEIIVIYYDVKSPFTPDQVKKAVDNAKKIFGNRIFTPNEKASLGRWPTPEELMNKRKQVIIEANSDSFANSNVVFYPTLTSEANGGAQFTVNKLTPFPECTINGASYQYGEGFFRAKDNSIAKGPALQPEPDKAIKPQDIRNVVNCGISTMGLDNVQPSYIAEMIWSWAVNEPSANGCTYMQTDGRWYIESNCELSLYHACVNNENRLDWKISTTAAPSQAPTCPDNYQFSYPITGYENSLVTQALSGSKVWLAYESNKVSNKRKVKLF